MVKKTKWAQRLGKLKSFKKARKESEKLTGGQLEAGTYKADVSSAELAESQSSEREQINMFVEISQGEEKGTSQGIFMGIDEQSLPYTLAALRRMGFEIPEDPAELEEVVEELNDSELPILIKVNDAGFASVLKKDDDAVEEGDEGDEGDEGKKDKKKKKKAEGEIEVGSTVTFEDDEGDEIEGEVTEIDEDNETADVTSTDDDEYEVELKDLTLKEDEELPEDPEDAPEDTIELGEGSKVQWERKGKTMKGEIVEILEDEDKARVEASDGKTYKVSADKLEPAPERKLKKKEKLKRKSKVTRKKK